MSDPYAFYTALGDRLLIHSAADHRRAWLTYQLERLAHALFLVRGR